MNACLYISIVCIILIMTIVVEIENYYEKYGIIKMNKYNLRNMYFETSYSRIMENADKQLAASSSFTIMCVPLKNNNCEKYNGYQKWAGKQYKTNIQMQHFRNRIINKLQSRLPNSTITKSYKNCCNYYSIYF